MKKSQNPNHFRGSLITVCRQDLEDSRNDPDVETRTEDVSTKDLAKLNQLLAPLASEFTAATQTRTRKRKRSVSPSKGQPSKSQKTEIRLLTHRAATIQETELESTWPSYPKVNLVEDTEMEEEERRCRSALAAVDFEFIKKQSSVSYPAYKPIAVEEYQLRDSTPVRPITVMESFRPSYPTPQIPAFNPAQPALRDPKPKAHLLTRARSIGTNNTKPRSTFTPRSFYFSDDILGGKSAGYAWGYRGSFPRQSGSSHYLRDNMKKGLDLEVSAFLVARSDHGAAATRGQGRRKR